MSEVLERDVEKQFEAGVELLGGKAVKIEGPKGFVDRLCIMPGGVTVYVELKRPGKVNTRTVHQLSWADVVADRGHFYICSDNVVEALNFIREAVRARNPA